MKNSHNAVYAFTYTKKLTSVPSTAMAFLQVVSCTRIGGGAPKLLLEKAPGRRYTRKGRHTGS